MDKTGAEISRKEWDMGLKKRIAPAFLAGAVVFGMGAFGTVSMAAPAEQQAGNIGYYEVTEDADTPDGEEGETAPVTLSAQSLRINVGDTGTLSVSVDPEVLPGDVTVEWSSSDGSVVEAAGSGTECTVKALKEGTATVTAAVTAGDGTEYTVECAVTSSNVKVSSIIVTTDDGTQIVQNDVVTLNLKDVLKLTVSLSPENATNTDVTWYIDDKSVVDITPDGTLTPMGVGATVVGVDADGASMAFTVETKVVNVEDIELTAGGDPVEGRLELKVGDTLEVKAVVTPEDATYGSVTYSSDNTDVMTVDENGVITAVAVGRATLTAATRDGKVVTAMVWVDEAASEDTASGDNTLENSAGGTGASSIDAAAGGSNAAPTNASYVKAPVTGDDSHGAVCMAMAAAAAGVVGALLRMRRMFMK